MSGLSIFNTYKVYLIVYISELSETCLFRKDEETVHFLYNLKTHISDYKQ